MSRKEKAQSITRIAVSLIFLAVIRSITCIFTFMPSLVFWLVAEIMAFADGCAIYNLIQKGRA